MAEPDTQQGKLYTLSEISKRTGISMPTLQRYKKTYQSRIPSVGQGRKQRYPESALTVFNDIKVENAGQRGRPRKTEARRGCGAAGGEAARPSARLGQGGFAAQDRRAARPSAGGGEVREAPWTPAQGGQRRRRSADAHRDQQADRNFLSDAGALRAPLSEKLPSEGLGRARRFYSQAVDVFRQLRSESPRGGRRKRGGGAKRAASANGRRRGARGGDGALTKRIKQLEKTQQNLEKKLKGLVNKLQKVFR